MKVISFDRMSVWERVKRYVRPSYKKQKDAEMRAAILHLLQHSTERCLIEGKVIQP